LIWIKTKHTKAFKFKDSNLKERREEGRKGGRKEGSKEGRKQGRKETTIFFSLSLFCFLKKQEQFGGRVLLRASHAMWCCSVSLKLTHRSGALLEAVLVQNQGCFGKKKTMGHCSVSRNSFYSVYLEQRAPNPAERNNLTCCQTRHWYKMGRNENLAQYYLQRD